MRETFHRCVGDASADHLISAAESLSTVFRNRVDAMLTEQFQLSVASRDEDRADKLRKLAAECDKGDVPD